MFSLKVPYMDQTSPPSMFLGQLVLLSLCLGGAKLFNTMRKKPLANGAAIYLVLGLLHFLVTLVAVSRGVFGNIDPYRALGAYLVEYLGPIGLAIFLTRSFARKKATFTPAA